MFIISLQNIETINQARDCTSHYASPCPNATNRFFAAEPIAGGYCYDLTKTRRIRGYIVHVRNIVNAETSTPTTKPRRISREFKLRKILVVGFFSSSEFCLQKAHDQPHCVNFKISAETFASHGYRSKDTPAPTQGVGCLISFIWGAFLL